MERRKPKSGRGNYNSGSDYVLEYGELRFTFNEVDFGQRLEQAAWQIGLIAGNLSDEEKGDLIEFVVGGITFEPLTELGIHLERHAEKPPEEPEGVSSETDSTILHWLRRLAFRSAWLDQRVIEGKEIGVRFDERNGTFGYVDLSEQEGEDTISLQPPPSWSHVVYDPNR